MACLPNDCLAATSGHTNADTFWFKLPCCGGCQFFLCPESIVSDPIDMGLLNNSWAHSYFGEIS
jgi:hypothetical protein